MVKLYPDSPLLPSESANAFLSSTIFQLSPSTVCFSLFSSLSLSLSLTLYLILRLLSLFLLNFLFSLRHIEHLSIQTINFLPPLDSSIFEPTPTLELSFSLSLVTSLSLLLHSLTFIFVTFSISSLSLSCNKF